MGTQAAFVPERVSFEDFLALYEGAPAEWVDGEVVEMSPTSDRHVDISDFLVTILRFLVAETGAGIVRSSQMAMRIGRVARVPDLLFLSSAHLERLRPNHVEGAADLAIEIVSRESRLRDHTEKLREYEQAGVREYWIIDPVKESVELYRLDGDGRYQRDLDGTLLRSEVLPGFWIDARWLWSAPLPAPKFVLREWGLI